jgi:uncharacterized protein (DUF1810 family)
MSTPEKQHKTLVFEAAGGSGGRLACADTSGDDGIQAPVLGQARAELENGRKASHWMWFVFPQLAGLGASAMARHYAIASRDEAAAFLNHGILGSRLRELTDIVNALSDRTARDIFGTPDDLKFRSSMTLFATVAEPDSVFERALEKFFGGARDPLTLRLLESRPALIAQQPFG